MGRSDFTAAWPARWQGPDHSITRRADEDRRRDREEEGLGGLELIITSNCSASDRKGGRPRPRRLAPNLAHRVGTGTNRSGSNAGVENRARERPSGPGLPPQEVRARAAGSAAWDQRLDPSDRGSGDDLMWRRRSIRALQTAAQRSQRACQSAVRRIVTVADWPRGDADAARRETFTEADQFSAARQPRSSWSPAKRYSTRRRGPRRSIPSEAPRTPLRMTLQPSRGARKTDRRMDISASAWRGQGKSAASKGEEIRSLIR